MDRHTIKMFLLGLSVFGVLIIGRIGVILLHDYYKVYFQGFHLLIVLTIVVPLIIGMLLGASSLRNNGSQTRNVSNVDWPQLLFLGIPALLFTLFPLVYMLGFFAFPLTKYTAILWNENFYAINALILGYVLLTSISTHKN